MSVESRQHQWHTTPEKLPPIIPPEVPFWGRIPPGMTLKRSLVKQKPSIFLYFTLCHVYTVDKRYVVDMTDTRRGPQWTRKGP